MVVIRIVAPVLNKVPVIHAVEPAVPLAKKDVGSATVSVDLVVPVTHVRLPVPVPLETGEEEHRVTPVHQVVIVARGNHHRAVVVIADRVVQVGHHAVVEDSVQLVVLIVVQVPVLNPSVPMSVIKRGVQ